MEDADAIARDIEEALRACGGEGRIPTHDSQQEYLGVYAKDLRQVLRSFKLALKGAPGELVHAVALSLLAKKVLECRQIAYELVAAHGKARSLVDADRLEALGQGMDSWVCVDTFCANVAGPAWMRGQVDDDLIRSWSESDNLWWRRASVVATVSFNNKSRGGTGDTRRTLEMCQRAAGDSEIMVQKAISWALRMLVRWDRQAVEAFLEEYGDTVASLVRREVRNKLATGKKNPRE